MGVEILGVRVPQNAPAYRGWQACGCVYFVQQSPGCVQHSLGCVTRDVSPNDRIIVSPVMPIIVSTNATNYVSPHCVSHSPGCLILARVCPPARGVAHLPKRLCTRRRISLRERDRDEPE